MVAEWAEEAALTNCRSNGVRSSSSSGNNGISSTARQKHITGSSKVVDLGAAIVAGAQGAIATKWPASRLHCMRASPALSLSCSLLDCCLLAAPCCLYPFSLACLSLSACLRGGAALPPRWHQGGRSCATVRSNSHCA